MSDSKGSGKRIYKVIFFNQGRIYEVFAKSVTQGELFGFVTVEQLLFGEKTKVVVDPSEESLKLEFSGVRRTFVPLHAVVRIDEVEKEGTARITQPDKGGTVTTFPTPIYTPGGADSPKKS